MSTPMTCRLLVWVSCLTFCLIPAQVHAKAQPASSEEGRVTLQRQSGH